MATLDEWVQPTVDPEVRAYVSSLVTAVGGSSADEDGRYVLGDEALATLKDLRRWLSLYDQALNRYDVARCLAEANFVQGDLLEILSQWPEEQTDNVLKHKLALACLELLVPLTWPYEVAPEEMTVNHHRHLPYLRLAQARYKRAILHHDVAKILRTAIRVALPSMAQPRSERTTRDEAIIRIVLYFLRNMAMIAQPARLPSEGDDCEISRSATIDAFHEQDIFQVLLTVSSSMGDEFVFQDVVILETLFHLLKGVDPDKLFMQEENVARKHTEEFKNILKKEKTMLASQSKYAPTRHNRFGTMIWVKRDDEKVSTVSGQDILGNAQRSLEKMDTSKKWNKPKYRSRATEEHTERDEFDKPVHISATARKHLRAFVDEFLDSSFNPLFTHLRKAIEREAERVQQDVHPMQFFYLISWFLRAERARRRATQKARKDRPSATATEDESFALVAGVMNQETFILLNRFMQRSEDDKKWQDLNAGMKCFTEVLLTVQEMADSPVEDDQDIAENIQNRIFYEGSNHDRILHILRTYKDQGVGYLDASTELAHVFIRTLERYSKQNVDLQVRSRRRARKKRNEQPVDGVAADGGENNSEAEDLVEAQRTSSERKFDFAKFSARFMTQSSVNTFVALTTLFSDLNAEQLKRAHRFFYRLAFKNELAVLLFRVDILQLFHRMIKGPQGLDPELPCFKEWEELVKQIFRKAINKIQERPELIVEMLFSKIPATLFYLEHGYEQERETRAPRPPAELEIRPGQWDKTAVAFMLLFDHDKYDAIQWVTHVLGSAIEERKSWEALEAARKATADALGDDGDEIAVPSVEQAQAPAITITPDSDERRVALFRDNQLRLFLAVLGFERLGAPEDPDASWSIPSSLTSAELARKLEDIEKYLNDPPTFGDGELADELVRTKVATESVSRRRRASFDDDSSGPDDQDPEEFLYPAGGPTARRTNALERLKKRRRRRRLEDGEEETDDEERRRRAERRRQNELQKRRKIKSELYVRDSDDETDEEADREFFAKEEQRRIAARLKINKALQTGIALNELDSTSKKRKAPKEGKSGRGKRRRSESGSDEDSTGDDGSRASSEEPEALLDMETSEDEDDVDTPLSSLQQAHGDGLGGAASSDEEMEDDRPPKPAPDKGGQMQGADGDEDDEVMARRPGRRHQRAGFVIDSDSE